MGVFLSRSDAEAALHCKPFALTNNTLTNPVNISLAAKSLSTSCQTKPAIV